ncbi:MAG: hypothetical protein KKI08_13510, partial [Armatimonadetes bacterium]|nr:hypothetical protein [Armatimonadota bacterium]
GTLTCNASCKLDVSGCADLVGMVRALQDTAASVWTVFNPPFMTGSEQWRPDWIPLDTCVSGPFALASISVMSNLHAGKLTISGGIVDPVTIVPLSEGPIKVTTYKDDLPNGTSLLVAPGDTLTLTGAGGDDVGPFNASVKAPSSLKGLTHGPLNAFFGLDSTKPMSFTWPLPAHDGDVLIYLSEWDDETYQTTAELLCHPADDGSFEVPVSDMSWFSGLHPGTVRVQRWSSSMAADTKGNGTLFAVVAQTEESIAPILPPG